MADSSLSNVYFFQISIVYQLQKAGVSRALVMCLQKMGIGYKSILGWVFIMSKEGKASWVGVSEPWMLGVSGAVCSCGISQGEMPGSFIPDPRWSQEDTGRVTHTGVVVTVKHTHSYLFCKLLSLCRIITSCVAFFRSLLLLRCRCFDLGKQIFEFLCCRMSF